MRIVARYLTVTVYLYLPPKESNHTNEGNKIESNQSIRRRIKYFFESCRPRKSENLVLLDHNNSLALDDLLARTRNFLRWFFFCHGSWLLMVPHHSPPSHMPLLALRFIDALDIISSFLSIVHTEIKKFFFLALLVFGSICST